MSHLKKGNHPPSTAPLESSSNSNSNYDTMDESRLNLQAPAFERVQRGSGGNESNTNNNANEMEEKVCRICLEEDSPETMIAPCLCKGGSKWVHRECLDEWRTNEKDRAFAKCTECLFEYHLQPVYKKDDDDDDEELPQTCIVCCVPRTKCTQQQRRKALFYWMVSRDACLGIALQQLIIVFLAYLVWICDPDHDLPILLRIPNIGANNLVWLYYGFGWFLFFMFLGFYGSVVMCLNDCDIQKSIPRVGPPTEADARDAAPSAPASSQTTSTGARTATPSTARSTAGTVLNVLEAVGTPEYRYDPYRDDYDDYYRRPRYPYSSSTMYYRRARRRYYHRNRPRRWYYDDYRRRRWYDDEDYYYYYGPSYYPIYVDDGGGGCCCCCCCDSGADHHARTCTDCCNSGHHHACLSFFSSSSSGSSSGSGGRSGGSNSNGNDAEHIVLLIMLVVAIVMAIIGFCVGVVITVVATQRIVGRHIYLLQKRQLVREFQVMDLQDYDLDQPISSATRKSNRSNNNNNNTSSSSSSSSNATNINAPSQTSPLLSGGDGQGLEMASTRHPPPSAPVMPADDVKYLKSLGLLDR